jgi:hypothetical protein
MKKNSMRFKNFRWSWFIYWALSLFVVTLLFEILWDLVAGNVISKNFTAQELVRRFVAAVVIAFLFSLFKWEKRKKQQEETPE